MNGFEDLLKITKLFWGVPEPPLSLEAWVRRRLGGTACDPYFLVCAGLLKDCG